MIRKLLKRPAAAALSLGLALLTVALSNGYAQNGAAPDLAGIWWAGAPRPLLPGETHPATGRGGRVG